MVAADLHQKVRVSLDAPGSFLVHGVDFLLQVCQERSHHELDLNFLLILVPKQNFLAVLLTRFNLLENVAHERLFIDHGLDEVSSLAHPNLDLHVQVSHALDDDSVNLVLNGEHAFVVEHRRQLERELLVDKQLHNRRSLLVRKVLDQ